VRAESDFPSIGERLRAALWSYQKGIGVDYELKATKARGFKASPLLDDLGFELLALIDDGTRVSELEQLIVQLRNMRTSRLSRGTDSPL
jgi:hypothetical protein